VLHVTCFAINAAGQIPGYPGMDQALMHQAAGAYQRQPTLIPPRDAVLGLHPELLGRPYPPELAHHVSISKHRIHTHLMSCHED
jgi:hypothetical protein